MCVCYNLGGEKYTLFNNILNFWRTWIMYRYGFERLSRTTWVQTSNRDRYHIIYTYIFLTVSQNFFRDHSLSDYGYDIFLKIKSCLMKNRAIALKFISKIHTTTVRRIYGPVERTRDSSPSATYLYCSFIIRGREKKTSFFRTTVGEDPLGYDK